MPLDDPDSRELHISSERVLRVYYLTVACCPIPVGIVAQTHIARPECLARSILLGLPIGRWLQRKYREKLRWDPLQPCRRKGSIVLPDISMRPIRQLLILMQPIRQKCSPQHLLDSALAGVGGLVAREVHHRQSYTSQAPVYTVSARSYSPTGQSAYSASAWVRM